MDSEWSRLSVFHRGWSVIIYRNYIYIHEHVLGSIYLARERPKLRVFLLFSSSPPPPPRAPIFPRTEMQFRETLANTRPSREVNLHNIYVNGRECARARVRASTYLKRLIVAYSLRIHNGRQLRDSCKRFPRSESRARAKFARCAPNISLMRRIPPLRFATSINKQLIRAISR